MPLIEIYVIGVIAEALYLLVKRLTWKGEKVSRFYKELDDLSADIGMNWRCWIPIALVLMCLLWPYSWIERLLLKPTRGSRQ